MITSYESHLVPYSIELIFRYDQSFLNRAELSVLEKIFEDENLYPAVQSTPGNLVARSLEAIVETNFIDLKAKGEVFNGRLQTIGFPIVTEHDPSSDPWCSFSWSMFQHNHAEMALIGSVFSTFENRKETHQEFSKIFQSFASKLYLATHPVEGYVLDPDADSNAWSKTSAAKLQLSTLNWLNFFGPQMVKKYGQEVLSHIPGYKVQLLADGGILHQSRPSIVIDNEIAHKRWQRDVTNYLASNGIQVSFQRI